VIHPNLIKRKADEDGLSASAVERDYVLAHALTAISRRVGQAGLVFKGGTALRLCHFDEYRYSADLDFSLLDGMKADDALELIADALVECQERVGFPIVRGVDAAAVWPVFERKARHRDRDPDEFAKRFNNLVPEWKRRWDRELVEYVDSPPHFEAALRAVRPQLRFAFH
jgi:hypothetical protein